jgi:AraC-like DNA-binding protein
MNIAIASARPDLRPRSAPRTDDAHHLSSFSAWKDFVHDNFPWLEHHNHSSGRFEALVSGYQFADSSLLTIRAGASEVIRTPRLADASEAGFIKMVLTSAGQLVLEQDGRRCFMNIGQVAVCDTARPYRIRVSEGARFAVLMMPYSACADWERLSQLICGKNLVDSAITRAAFAALMSLTSIPAQPIDCRSEGAIIIRAVQWMLSTSLHRTSNSDSGEGYRDARMCKARRYIEDHIADPELNADNVAAAVCMSRRALYSLFGEHKVTPAKLIHNIRLDRAMQALNDPEQRHRKITDLAFDCGFSDYATFSRMFKTRFGCPPSQSRPREQAPRRSAGRWRAS